MMFAKELRRRLVAAPLLALLFALGGCVNAPVHPSAYSPLILISIDGYRADYIARGL